ncbi:MAG: AMP-binding enzyme [Steroidobacteraceae bacterium]
MSLDAEVLKQHCRQLVAGYKVPRVVAFVAEVPRTNTGKPDYSTAKKLATAQLS